MNLMQLPDEQKNQDIEVDVVLPLFSSLVLLFFSDLLHFIPFLVSLSLISFLIFGIEKRLLDIFFLLFSYQMYLSVFILSSLTLFISWDSLVKEKKDTSKDQLLRRHGGARRILSLELLGFKNLLSPASLYSRVNRCPRCPKKEDAISGSLLIFWNRMPIFLFLIFGSVVWVSQRKRKRDR